MFHKFNLCVSRPGYCENVTDVNIPVLLLFTLTCGQTKEEFKLACMSFTSQSLGQEWMCYYGTFKINSVNRKL